MKKEPITKEKVVKALVQMVAHKEAVRAYMRGEIPMETLTKKGIKFAKPL